MGMEIPDNLTRRDKDILHILWNSDESMTAAQIVSGGKGLTMNTVQAVLRKLLKSNLIEVDKIVYSGTVLSRSYRPVMSEADFEISGFCGRYGTMKKRVPVSSVMEALLGTVDNSADIEHEIDKMEEMLEQYKREHIK
ncbi:MAG: BlaI/MecI/CopY family transcriptional regulator [Lachnospiraceae bacterium]|nr:BlaI/MecI/CopY family transcriptional regulator [Lachnospiraceae bacterium]